MDLDGDTIRYTNSNSTIDLSLTETPQFVVVSGNSTNSMKQSFGKLEFNVYPNPANTEVQISFIVPEKQKVNLSAYSMDGKLIETIVEGTVESGTHQYSFGKGLQAGTYLLCVKSATASSFRKVILLN